MLLCITGRFEVPGENDNDRRLIDFCAERGLSISNTYFEHWNLHKYTRVARGQEHDMRTVGGTGRFSRSSCCAM